MMRPIYSALYLFSEQYAKDFLSSIRVISNCFFVYYYSVLLLSVSEVLQKCFQTLLMSGVFVVLHNTKSRGPYHPPTQTPAGFSLNSRLQTQGKLR